MAPSTRQAKETALKQMLSTILDQEDDDPIPLALKRAGSNTIPLVVDLTHNNIDKLKYLVDDGLEQDGTTPKFKEENLPDGYKALLKIFKTYVSYEKEVNGLKLHENWSLINKEDFNDYRFSQECSYRVMQLGNGNPPTTSSQGRSLQYAVTTQSLKAMSADPIEIVRREWKKGIKRDATAYQNFTTDKQWENWNRGFVLTTHAQMMQDVLNPTYKPNAGSVDDATFQLQQVFMYDVLNKVVQTSKGKELLRSHHKTFNAQKVYELLCTHYQTSTAADIAAQDTYQYIITARIDAYRGTAEQFIMHWFEQVRLYEETSETEAHLTGPQKKTLLVLAVASNPDLAQIDNNYNTMLSLDPTMKPSIDQYRSLLLSAAVKYDRRTGSVKKNPVRQVYAHDNTYADDADLTFDIDTPHYDVMKAEAESRPATRTLDSNPRRTATLRWDQWKDLPDGARKLWDTLDDDDKHVILRYHDPNRPKNTRVQASYHDISNEVNDADGFTQLVVYGVNQHQARLHKSSTDASTVATGNTTISTKTPSIASDKGLPPGHPQRMLSQQYSVNVGQSKSVKDDFCQ